MRVFTTIGLCAFIAWAASAQAYRLQYKDAADATRTYQSEFAMKGVMAMPGTPDGIPLQTVNKFTITEQVKKVAEGVASIETKLKEGSIVSTISGQQMTQPMPPFAMTFDRTPLGNIRNIKTQTTAFMPGMGNDGQMHYLNQITGTGQFPDKELKIGDSWETKETLEVMGGAKMELVATTKLSGVQVVDGVSYLVLDTDMTLTMPMQPVKMPGMASIQTAMQMRGKSSSLFNEGAGEFFRSTTTGTLTVTMSAGMGELGDFTTTATLEMTGTTTKK